MCHYIDGSSETLVNNEESHWMKRTTREREREREKEKERERERERECVCARACVHVWKCERDGHIYSECVRIIV